MPPPSRPSTSHHGSFMRLPSSSGGWNRLRAPQIDPLEVYGLASKGETRLLDPKTQESYFRLITKRYLSFCAASGPGLEDAFAGMSLAPTSLGLTTNGVLAPATTPPTTSASSASPGTEAPKSDAELALLLSAMRKLREALLASRRKDPFAQRVYYFILRAALLMRSWEGYGPCITALLRMHDVLPLQPGEIREVVGYAVLDAGCRLGELGRAISIRAQWRGRGVGLERETEDVLRALVRDDYLLWRDVGRRVDGFGRAMMGFAEGRMRVHVLKVVGRAYMRIELATLEAWTGMSWDGLVREGVGWERDGDWVVVRKAKR